MASTGERLPQVQDHAERAEYRSPGASGGSSVGQRASERVRQKASGLAAIVREERMREKNQYLLKGDGGVSRKATNAEQESVAVMLNHRMEQIFLDPQARSWYKLFCHMDDDLSGKVSFHEFEDMIRNELKVSSEKLGMEQLRAIWKSLDEDGSGLITAGEFGHFMRIGAPAQNVEESSKFKVLKRREMEGLSARKEHKELISTWKDACNLASSAVVEKTDQLRKAEAGRTTAALERVKQQNAAAAQSMRNARDERLGRHLMKSDSGPTPRRATDTECEQFAIFLNQRMVEIFLDPQARSWYKLFVHMDDDLSGKINFHELQDMIRNELKVPHSRLSDEQMKALWLALDEDKSGLITAGEFGKFMRLGAHIHTVGESSRAKVQRAKTADGAATRQEKTAWEEQRKQFQTTDQAMRKTHTSEMREAAWGMRAPDPRAAWRGPNAFVF